MKKTAKYIIAAASVLCACVSCYKQEDVYKEFIKVGGYIYPAKAVSLTAVSGHSRVVLSWERPEDPAVKSAEVFWDNYTQSLPVDYDQFPDGNVSVDVGNLEDRSYTFDVVNYDASGNKSLPAELTVAAYGDSWLVTHSERTLVNAEMVGEDAHVTLTKSTDEMMATKFRYKGLDGQWIEYDKYLQPGENEIVLPKALKGKKFEFKSGYRPEGGLDTVWNNSWVRSAYGILYELDTRNWKVTVTEGQVNGNFTPDKIFDGICDQPANRWHSSTDASKRLNFPKVLAIDTGAAEGHEPSLYGYKLWGHPESQSYRYMRTVQFYVGAAPFDPDDKDFAVKYEDSMIKKAVLTKADAMQSGAVTTPETGRYMALSFPDSFNTNGYVDVWEFAPVGYIEAESE